MFAQRLNVVTGEYEWVAVSAEGDGDPGDESSAIVAASSYLDMLSDTYRNRAYFAALRATVRPGNHVLDIGTGTGLLAMMAARLLEGVGSVSACEVFPPMANLAKRVVAANGLEQSVTVLPARSSDVAVAPSSVSDGGREFTIPRRADVIVTEIFDSELLGEGLLPTLLHAVPHLLKTGGRVVPAAARCFFQVAESEWLQRCSPPPPPGAAANPSFHTMRALHLPAAHVRPLAPPVELLSFRLAEPPTEERTQHAEVVATDAGRAGVIVFWWQLEMDEAASVLISTAPPWITQPAQGGDGGALLGPEPDGVRQQWRDHWRSCWCPIGEEGGFRVAAGQKLRVTARHDELNVFAGAKPCSGETGPTGGGGTLDRGARDDSSSPSSFSSLELVPQRELAASSPNRICRLRESSTWERFAAAVKEAAGVACARGGALPAGEQRPRCVVLGDSTPVAALAAAETGIGTVTALQEDAASRLLLTEWMDTADGTAARALTSSGEKKLVMNRLRPWLLRLRHQAQENDAQPAFDMAVSEPFYRSCEGLLPWAELSRYWHELSLLRESGALAASAPLLPSSAAVRCVAVSLPELWRTRQAVESVEGIDLRLANPLLGGIGSAESRPLPPLSGSAWQWGNGYRELSDHVALFGFDFSQPAESQQAELSVTVQTSGLCHALLLYTEYHDRAGRALVTNAPGEQGGSPCHRVQGVQLLPAALRLQAGGRNLRVCATWNAEEGEIRATASL